MKKFQFTRQQEEFIRAEQQIVIGSGSVGAGKSFVIGSDAYATAIQYPNSRILITRDNFTDLRKSTIQTLLNKVIPSSNVVEHNKSEHRIVVKAVDGKTSEIWYEGLDKGASDDYPTKIGSTEFNRIYVDEGFELDKGDFQFLLTRLRHEAYNQSGEMCNWQIKTATNPGGPTHWMKTDYIDKEDERDDIKVVRFLTEDNEFIDKQYLQNLKQQYPDGSMMRDRLLKGKWVASEGLVYPNFDMEKHVVSKDQFIEDYDDYKRIVVGADSGWKNPRALAVLGVTGSGSVHVLDEFYRSKTSVQDAVDWLNSKEYEINAIYHDPSEPEEIQEYKKSGYNCKKGVNDIIPGITEMSKYFAETDGKKILVGKHCTNFINELLSYRYPEGTSRGKSRNEDETPIKEQDHILDGTRYALMGLKKGGTEFKAKKSPFAKGKNRRNI